MKLLNIMSCRNRFVIVTKTHSVLFGLKFEESWVMGNFYRFDNFMTLYKAKNIIFGFKNKTKTSFLIGIHKC